jgi:hypothetical protein
MNPRSSVFVASRQANNMRTRRLLFESLERRSRQWDQRDGRHDRVGDAAIVDYLYWISQRRR